MSVKLIVAVSKEWGIGFENNLLFSIPDDMKRFRHLTVGEGEPNLVLMGSKTYESLPVDKIPNRINVVLSRNPNYPVPSDVFVINSFEHAINHYLNGSQNRDLWIIGGATLYSHALSYVDEVYLTYIDKAAKKADTFFNRKMLEDNFYITGFKKNYCEKNDLNFYYVNYRNKKDYVHRWDEFRK